jgi:Zn-dependent protease with chaperone function
MEIKRYFKDISSRAWEHPADREALSALESVPGLDGAVRSIIGATTERSLRLSTLASSARVGPRQFSGLHAIVQEAAAVLDLRELPEVFVTQGSTMNARTIGAEHPFITIETAMLDAMTDGELLAVIGHEIGHIMSGHAAYKTFIWYLANAAGSFAALLPLGSLAIDALVGALNEWDRKSELSADRASLLVTQDLSANYGALIKVIGGSHASEIDLNELFLQAEDYIKENGAIDNLNKIVRGLGLSHPYPVFRLTELQSWSKSEAYAAALDGRYPRRGGEGPGADSASFFSKGAEGFMNGFDASPEALQKTAGEVLDGVKKSAEQTGKQFEDFLSKLSGGKNP